ncbi:MAG: NAD(P)H-dependent glycerol-3-phosphate dehydrogenase [Actinomycetota bacterium]
MKNLDKKFNILIIGAGSWGTTLSVVLAKKADNIYLWARNRQTMEAIRREKKNKKYTGNLLLPSNIIAFNSLEDIKRNPDLIIFAVPSHALRAVIEYYRPCLEKLNGVRAVVNAAKGLETGTNLRLSEVMAQTLPVRLNDRIVVLSGPNISSEIAQKLPSVSTISSKNHQCLRWLQQLLSTDYFRIYTNRDIAGVEIGGAVKNIIAIAAGISDGLGFGTNTKASLVTRGLNEITKFGTRLGAKASTFAGISGMGDLITTCFNLQSRNRLFGQKIAGGQKPKQVKESMFMVAEGFNTCQAVYQLSKKLDIDMPITECVYDILYNETNPQSSVYTLMSRKFKPEIEEY